MSIFQYATIEDVREENVSVNTHDDDRVLEFIELASRFINLQTEQFFVPIREQHLLDGSGTPTLNSQNRIPIQEIKSISDDELPPSQSLQPSDLEIPNQRSRQRREVLLRVPGNQNTVFTNGTNNIKMDGIFGWLEPRFKEPYKKEVVASSSYSDTEITLEDTERIEDHFIPVIGKETYPVISEVDGDTIKFDQEIRFPVEPGDQAVFYGLTPKPIRRVAVKIAIKSAKKLGSGGSQGGLDFTETPEFKSRVVSERTDNYSYRLAQDVPEGVIKQGDLTSNVYTILKEYTVDPFFKMGAV
jgi:hypothetical protein